ncbi:MAG: VOC family protein [Cyclobacteriaceae bacterium]
MQKTGILLILALLVLSGCKNFEEEHEAFTVFCEMVANGAKPIALSHPLEKKDADDLWNAYQQIADQYKVQIFREDNFPVTPLFPADATSELSVIIIYKGDRLTQYRQLKKDITEKPTVERDQLLTYARRLGRLLGYDTDGINSLLSQNSDFKTLSSFDVNRQITHLYYNDREAALKFYRNTLGLQSLDSISFYIGKDALIRLHETSEIHPQAQEKSTAIALLTDQLAEWYQYVLDKEVPIKYTYKPKEGGPHDGFVAIDPGGYLLEFEQFKQHPENELFIAVLSTANPVRTSVGNLEFYGGITWTYHKDLLLMQDFYENTLGFQLVADQGWTKIYQTAGSAFIGLVDERRGMQNYAENKAVEIEWSVSDMNDLKTYADKYWEIYRFDKNSFIGPENYLYRVSK